MLKTFPLLSSLPALLLAVLLMGLLLLGSADPLAWAQSPAGTSASAKANPSAPKNRASKNMAAKTAVPKKTYPADLRQQQREQRQETLVKMLDLNPKQRQSIRAIKAKSHSQAEALHQTLRQKREALQAYVTAPGARQEKALTMQKEVQSLQKQLSELRMKTWFQIRENLTQEQINKMEAMRRSPPHENNASKPGRRKAARP